MLKGDIMARPILRIAIVMLIALSCSERTSKDKEPTYEVTKVGLTPPHNKAIAAFAEGCFWCTEHIFESVVGIDSAISGYAGGTVPFPTYEMVNTETTGHAESILVYYNPSVITYAELTQVFFTSHDPTTPDRQGPDVGSSYRSILFYITPSEKEIAESSLNAFASSGMFKDSIVTEIKELNEFYRAEEYHQDYIQFNPDNPYVRNVSIPRFELFKKTYKGKLK
jgi:peptide-methionine (S)-S-oxide reductase